MFRAAIAVLAIALSATMAQAQTGTGSLKLPVVTYSADLLNDAPPSLTSMYVTQAALQGLDVFTTMRALDAGHREMNPLLKSGNGALLIGSKAAAATASIYVARKVWKKNPKAAMWTMVLTNALLTAVVANNSRVIETGR